MARASPLSSYSSSSSSVLPSSASPPSSRGTRKKKNIGALLSSYYNLENESKEEASDFAAASSSSSVGGGRAAANDVAANGAASVPGVMNQLQQRQQLSRDKAAAGAASGTAGGSVTACCTTSFNPFSATDEDSSSLISAGSAVHGDKRTEEAFPLVPSSRSPRAFGGRALAAAAGADRLGGETSTAASTQVDHNATAVSGARGGGFAAAAEGALAAAAGGLGLLLGEDDKEDSSSRQDMRWRTERDDETGPSLEDSKKDLDSEHFDVRAFFSAAVENMSLRELLQASSRLDEEVKQCEGELQMLVYENYTKFLEAAETVRGVKEDMHALEGDMTQLAVRATAIEGSSKELDDLVRDRAASIEELVSFRQLLDKLQILFTLPDVLRWYLLNGDIESVVSLYLRIHPFLQEQETAFPTLQRLHLLHTEATTLFEAAKRRLREQFLVPQAAGYEVSSSSDVSTRDSTIRITSKYLSGLDSGYDDRSSGSTRKDVLMLRQTTSDAVEEGVQFVSAAAASHVFDLLLRAGDSPREVLELYMRSRIRLLQLLLLRVFDAQRLFWEAQPTSQDPKKSAQQQQQLEQQQQQGGGQSVFHGEDATATSSAAPAAATEECTAAAHSVSSAAAQQMLQLACSHLSQHFMDPFLAALQDILRLHPSSGSRRTASGEVGGGRFAAAAAAGVSSAAAEKRGTSAAPCSGLKPAASSAAPGTTEYTSAAGEAGTAAPDDLSADELDEKVCIFLMPLLLRVLEGFLRLIARLRPPATAVVETMGKLRAVLLQPLHRLMLSDVLQQRITECFHDFTYQVLSICVAEAFRSAYYQAARELAAIQRFCFSCTAPNAAAAAGAAALSSKTAIGAAPSTGNAEQTNRQDASVVHVESVCFFLNEQQQEEAQQLLLQKEHALLLRGCLAVTDIHKLVDGVCGGVRSLLVEKLVLQELGTWTEGYFSVFVAAVLRLVRDMPAAFQSCPLLRAEAEALRSKETARRSSRSSSSASFGDEKSSISSSRGSHDKMVDSKRNGTDFRTAFFRGKGEEEEEEENEQERRTRCCSCCYCWRFDAQATAGNGTDLSIERKRDDLVCDTTCIASLEKALMSRCISVEEEVAGAVAAAVIKHVAIPSPASVHYRSTQGDDKDSRGEETSTENSRTCSKTHEENLDAHRLGQQRPCRRSSEDSSEADIIRIDASGHARHAETPHTDVLAKREMSSGNEKEEESDASIMRTDLSYIGRTAVCCVVLMRLGRLLELHGVSKIVAVAAELFPSFPVNSLTSTAAAAASGTGVLETAAADASATISTVTSPPVGDQETAAFVAVEETTAAGAATGCECRSRVPRKQQQQQTKLKEPPLVRLRGVLQAALVTYVYLRGCQGSSLGTASLRQMLAHKVSPETPIPPSPAAAGATCTTRGSTADASPAPVIPCRPGTGATEDAKITAAAAGEEGKYYRAIEWLRLKDKEAQERLDARGVQSGGPQAGETASAAASAPSEGQVDLPADDAAGMSSPAGASTNPLSADSHSSNDNTSAAGSSLFLSSAHRDVPCGSHSDTTTTTTDSTFRRETCGSPAVPADVQAGLSAEPLTDGGAAEAMPVGVTGSMDTLLLLLHHCDEETFVFLGERRLAGSSILVLREGCGGGGVSGALLPGCARLPRRLQAAAAARDAAAATVEQRQQQHVRRLARLFGRRRTAIEKEMERLFARKQPVFSRVSFNRHKVLMAIFKVACRPILEAVRNALFTRLEVRQMQVECAAAAENLRDLVASEDGCVVDGLLDELVASSLRRCMHATQVNEPTDDTRLRYCVAAGGMDGRANPGLRSILSGVTTDVGRSLSSGAAAVTRWSPSAADTSVTARMAEGEKEDNDVLLEPTIVEEICNRCSDRYNLLLRTSRDDMQ